MDFMDFSFSNSTYTALLALFAAIFGVGYPLIIQAIGEIDKKYDSTLLLKCFEEEPDFKRFNKRVLTCIFFSITTPFILFLSNSCSKSTFSYGIYSLLCIQNNKYMPTFVQILDFIGTFAFAISGIRLASAKRFDWFGAYVVGLATAIGGGTIRDVLLDVTPGWMTNPIYLICTGLALIWVICFGRWLIRLNNTFFIFDTIGLALFTVVGVGKSIALGYPFWVAIIMGSITGAAGGVIRDVFINEIPLIFRKEIYAMACVVGGIAYWLCDAAGMESYVCQLVGGSVVFVTRILAVKYHICLPILKGSEETDGNS